MRWVIPLGLVVATLSCKSSTSKGAGQSSVPPPAKGMCDDVDDTNLQAVFDGGFTRLYYKWDTAGTGRYVKNAAAWLANVERFGDKVSKLADGQK